MCVGRGVMQGGPPTPTPSLQPLPQDRLWGRRSENWSPGDCSIHRLPPGAQGQRKQWEGRQLQAGTAVSTAGGVWCQPGERRWGLGRAHPHPPLGSPRSQLPVHHSLCLPESVFILASSCHHGGPHSGGTPGTYLRLGRGEVTRSCGQRRGGVSTGYRPAVPLQLRVRRRQRAFAFVVSSPGFSSGWGDDDFLAP